ncbi:Telomere-length maintenance and DNA damage repair [Dillenia turbinata]|uniref:Telomere-length maintenance and DNA damage repair n=1 Tax=Dillenia turbinata TaxID=194707 RepID=A0AAN8URN0_9MAGN
MVTSRDVQDIIDKLSSDKAKTREDGIKLLNTWLEGERSVPFCKYLGFKTSKLKPNQTPHPETWPFLVKLLTDCISKEVQSNKRRLPKLVFAKTLRIVIQRAEDSKYSGKPLPLVTEVKFLFRHILDILEGVPSFQSEYGTILRHILAAKDYRFHMRKKIYCGLVLLFMGKVESSLSVKDTSQYNPKEELFRCILTLHSLLENPPGDFPDKAREDIVKGFVRVFSLVRDEGKILRKLLECINTFLLNDGPNLDCQSLEIHKALPQFVFRCWLTSHDRSLKDQLILYSKLQLNLARSADERSVLVEQLLDIVGKELDQSNILVSAVARSDTVKDDKFETLTGTQYRLVELAAYVFYQILVELEGCCFNPKTLELVVTGFKSNMIIPDLCICVVHGAVVILDLEAFVSFCCL